MFVPDEGHGPRLPWENDRGSGFPRPGGMLGMDVGSLLRSLPASVRVAREVLEERGLDGPATSSASTGDRGPDRVADMPGGAEVLVRQRRARRKELIKEGLNVGAGVVGVFLVTGLALLGWGLGLETAAGSAAAAALGYGYVLGREVLADLAGVRERELRDADWG